MRENAKTGYKTFRTSNLARNIKHMTIVFDSNHSNTVILNKNCCAPSFIPNKLWLNPFMREIAKNALKSLIK